MNFEREAFTTPSARGLPIELRSRGDGGFYASPALLDCCLPTVQQLARLIAQLRGLLLNMIASILCFGFDIIGAIFQGGSDLTARSPPRLWRIKQTNQRACGDTEPTPATK